MSTAFSYDIRMLVCPNCGAPIHVPREGGVFECAYCHRMGEVVVNRPVAAPAALAASPAERPAEPAPGDAARSAQLAKQERERERLQRLARQREAGQATIDLSAPDDQAELDVDDVGKTIYRVRQSWNAARRSDPDRFFRLTIWLDQLAFVANDEALARATLETALDELQDPGHRHVLRCTMAENAVRAGDLAAAERWLEDCDPRPEDLTLDSVYRLARARLTEKRDDPGETLALLGERHDEVPFDDFHVAMAAVMRIDALHSVGRVQDAILELGWLDREHRSDWRVIRLHNPHACEPVLKLMVQARRQMTASFLLSGVTAMAVGVVLAWTAHWLAGLAAAGMTWIVLFMVLAGLTSPQPASRRMSAGVGASAVVSAGVGYWFGQDGWGYGLLASTVALVVLGFAALLVLAPGKE